MPVIAYKNGKKQVFSDIGWKLLGKNKHGWVEKAPFVIDNTVAKTEAPNMGPKNPAEEDVTLKTTSQKIDNTVGKTDEDINDQDNKTDLTGTDNGSSNSDPKEEFMKALEGISANQIKDFFDQEKPSIKYNKKAQEAALKTQLAEYLNYDLVKLQEKAL